MLQDIRTESCGPSASVVAELTRLETQAGLIANAFNPGMSASDDDMLYWLCTTCYEARIDANTKAVRVAASVKPAGVTDATIVRFERATAWPRNADAIISAYADELDMQPIELWARALARWQAHLEAQGATTDPREEAAAEAERAAGRKRERRRASSPRKPRPRTPRPAG